MASVVDLAAPDALDDEQLQALPAEALVHLLQAQRQQISAPAVATSR